jgi:ribosomal-protein-alanine N-acetyltransferase
MNSTKSLNTDLTLRWMIRRDLPHLLHIHHQTPALPLSAHDLLTISRSVDTGICVAEVRDRVVGFLIYRVALPTEMEPDVELGTMRITLLNVAVAPAWQRQGVGRALIERFKNKLSGPQDHIEAVVPESNLAAQLLLRETGFKAVRILRGHFDDEDGYLMRHVGG